MGSLYDSIVGEALANAEKPLHPQSDALRNTLAMINAQRAAQGFPLMQSFTDAIKGNTAQCLYARAYGDMAPGVSVSGEGTIRFPDTKVGRELAFGLSRMPGARMLDATCVRAPDDFERVINSFDRGDFPEFDPDRDDPYYDQ